MARKRARDRRSEKRNSHRVTRRSSPFANPRIVTSQRKLSFDYSSWIDDQRLFAPPVVKKFRPFYTVSNAPVVIKERYKPNGRFQSFAITPPSDPLKLCYRRRERREVLFAAGRGGKISRRARRNRRTASSSISC